MEQQFPSFLKKRARQPLRNNDQELRAYSSMYLSQENGTQFYKATCIQST
jgi:hypothetical protein